MCDLSLGWQRRTFLNVFFFFFFKPGNQKKCKPANWCECVSAPQLWWKTARFLHCHLQGSLSITRFAILTEMGKKRRKQTNTCVPPITNTLNGSGLLWKDIEPKSTELKWSPAHTRSPEQTPSNSQTLKSIKNTVAPLCCAATTCSSVRSKDLLLSTVSRDVTDVFF